MGQNLLMMFRKSLMINFKSDIINGENGNKCDLLWRLFESYGKNP